MTDKDFGSKAFEMGYLDALGGIGRVRLKMLVTLAEPSDRELSDYWYGYHQGKAVSRRAAHSSVGHREGRC